MELPRALRGFVPRLRRLANFCHVVRDERLPRRRCPVTPFTALYNTTGPAISLPLATSPEGLPIGMQFAARFADEATLLRLAGQLEQAQPWRDRRPPVHLASEKSAS